MTATFTAQGPVTKDQANSMVAQFLVACENHGTEGDYRDPKENPIVYAAQVLLEHMSQTHPDGIRGMLRTMRHIEASLYRLDE